MTPPNFGSGAGNCLLLMVVVALGEPGVPVICWAMAGRVANEAAVRMTAIAAASVRYSFFMSSSLPYFNWSIQVGLANHFSPRPFMYPAFSMLFKKFCSQLTSWGSPLGTAIPMGS